MSEVVLVDVTDETAMKQVRDAVEAAAWDTGHGCDYCDHRCGDQRKVVHSQAGGMGADWDLEDVLTYLFAAERVAWVPSIFRHELAVESAGRIVHFQVRRPT